MLYSLDPDPAALSHDRELFRHRSVRSRSDGGEFSAADEQSSTLLKYSLIQGPQGSIEEDGLPQVDSTRIVGRVKPQLFLRIL